MVTLPEASEVILEPTCFQVLPDRFCRATCWPAMPGFSVPVIVTASVPDRRMNSSPTCRSFGVS